MADTKLPIDLLKLKFAAAKKRKVEENIYDIDPISDDEDGPGMYSVLFKNILYSLLWNEKRISLFIICSLFIFKSATQ